MLKTIKLSLLGLLLVSCSSNSEISISSTSTISNITSSSSTIVNTEKLKTIASVENIKYEIDYTAQIVMPDQIKVVFEDGSDGFAKVIWKDKMVSYQNNDEIKISGNLYEYEKTVDATISFKDYIIIGSMKDQLSISNERLKLYYTKNDETSIEDLFNYLNYEYDRIKNFFDLSNNPLITGFIYPNVRELKKGNLEEFNVFLPGEGWGAGVNEEYFTMISPLAPPVPTNMNSIYNIAAHEMLHSIHVYQTTVSDKINDFEQTPIWLREGIATYMTEDFIYHNILHVNFINRSDFKISDLNDREHPGNLPYVPGAFLVMYLLETYGYQAFKDYMYDLNLLTSFNKDELAISNEFKEYYLNLYSKFGRDGKYRRKDYP